MEEITKKLKKIMESRKHQKLIYKQSNARSGKLIVNE